MGTALAENIDPGMCSWTTFKRPNVRSLSQFQPQPNAYLLPSRCWHRYPARSYTAQKTSAFNWIKKRRGVTLKNAKSWKDIALPIHHRKRSSFQWFQTPFWVRRVFHVDKKSPNEQLLSFDPMVAWIYNSQQSQYFDIENPWQSYHGLINYNIYICIASYHMYIMYPWKYSWRLQ